jgi:hypothetical protein
MNIESFRKLPKVEMVLEQVRQINLSRDKHIIEEEGYNELINIALTGFIRKVSSEVGESVTLKKDNLRYWVNYVLRKRSKKTERKDAEGIVMNTFCATEEELGKCSTSKRKEDLCSHGVDTVGIEKISVLGTEGKDGGEDHVEARQQGMGEQSLGEENAVIVHEAVEYTAGIAECNENDGYEKESDLHSAEKMQFERRCDGEESERKEGNVTGVTAEYRNSEGKTGQYKHGEECTMTLGSLMSVADEKAADSLEAKVVFVEEGKGYLSTMGHNSRNGEGERSNKKKLVQSVENAEKFLWTDDERCKELMRGWEALHRSQLSGHRRAYYAWVKDVKLQGNFRGKKKPKLPITAEQRKERYIANRNGAQLSSDEGDTDMEASTSSDLGYPSDYKSEEDPYSDFEIFELENDENLKCKQRKERWLSQRRSYKSKDHRNVSAIEEEEK